MTKKWFQNNMIKVMNWPSHCLDLNSIEHLWRDLKIAAHKLSQSDLRELEQFCHEDWEKVLKINVWNLRKTIKTVY